MIVQPHRVETDDGSLYRVPQAMHLAAQIVTATAFSLEAPQTLAGELYAARDGVSQSHPIVDDLGRLRPFPRALSTPPRGPCAQGAEQMTTGRVGPPRIAQTGRGAPPRLRGRCTAQALRNIGGLVTVRTVGSGVQGGGQAEGKGASFCGPKGSPVSNCRRSRNGEDQSCLEVDGILRESAGNADALSALCGVHAMLSVPPDHTKECA